MKQYYRHGDLSFHEITVIEGEEIKHNGSFILALGEATGHKHVITVSSPANMRIFKDREGRYILELLSEARISHEEHKTITLKPGKYLQQNEREFDHFANSVRRVID